MWCSPARFSLAGKFLAGLRRAVGDGGLRLVTGIYFVWFFKPFSSVFAWSKKKRKKKREMCRETEKGLVIYVHDLNQMSVASCRCNEGRKKKEKKKKEAKLPVLFSIHSWLIFFGP